MKHYLLMLLATSLIGHASDRPDGPPPSVVQQWLAAHLLDCPLPPVAADKPVAAEAAPVPGLDVYANHDPVTQNSRSGQPMRIGERTFTRGLYCHAVSTVEVRLPAAGKRFVAVVGLDHNDDTAHGKGSVVFALDLSGRTAFRSGIMRYGSPAQNVSVDLSGASTFTLKVGDADDGISWDQSDWADARVELEDGRQLWLGDMPLRDHRGPAGVSPLPRTSALPFSFEVGGKASDELLAGWRRTSATRQLDGARSEHTETWTEPKTGLELRCIAVAYADFPAVEWTVYFRNTGTEPTPMIQNIQGLDFSMKSASPVVLDSWNGDTCSPELYELHSETLDPGTQRHFAPADGRGSNGAFPYYNLRLPTGGMLLAVGWPGQWASTFLRGADGGLRLIAGQELTHLKLLPGEQIRTPLAALVFWDGTDTVAAHNLWRRWMWAHNVPRNAEGQLPPSILFGNTSGEFNEMTQATEQNQIQFIDRYVEERIPIDCWWMDAGWYPCAGEWPKTGTWEPDLTRFPHGLRAISDHALTKGIKTLVWFEPERVGGGWLAQHHPEWLLGPLLDLGNPAAWQWLVDHVDGQITSQGIHIYRQDFNMSPLACWRGNDAPERQGITENLHVQGYLAYWDELRRRHPGLMIDSCASGGRRNDLESMRRAVPLHPTDYNYADLTVKQAFHHSLYQWIPYFGSNTVPMDSPDAYVIRSGQSLGTTFGYDMRRKDLDYERLRQLSSQLKQVVEYYRGDFYPLTPGNRSTSEWIAWQFHLVGRNAGMVQAFRRDANETQQRTFRLSGLDPAAQYRVHNLDEAESTIIAGRDLIDHGLTIHLAKRPSAAVICYEPVAACQVWLIKQKQLHEWHSTKATADAIHALLMGGGDLLGSDELLDMALGGTLVKPEAVEPGSGLYEARFAGPSIKPEMGHIRLTKTDPGIAWASISWQYLDDLAKVTEHETSALKLEKKMYVRKNTDTGPKLEALSGPVKVGDELVTRLILRNGRAMEFVHLKDLRGSGTEPVNGLSGYHWQDGLGYYEVTRDSASHFFIDSLPAGTHVFETSVRVQHAGIYQTGVAEISCMYAPGFSAHSASVQLQVVP